MLPPGVLEEASQSACISPSRHAQVLGSPLRSPLVLPELSNMSFEDILKLQKKVGTKVYNKVAYGSDQSADGCKKNRRLNRNR